MSPGFQIFQRVPARVAYHRRAIAGALVQILAALCADALAGFVANYFDRSCKQNLFAQRVSQFHSVLDRLTRPLPKVRTHRMGSIPKQRRPADTPMLQGITVIDIVPKDRAIFRCADESFNRLVPSSKQLQ